MISYSVSGSVNGKIEVSNPLFWPRITTTLIRTKNIAQSLDSIEPIPFPAVEPTPLLESIPLIE